MVYTNITLSMVKHTDHISRSAYLEIRKIGSTHHLMMKATAQLMCSFVLSRLNYCNSLLTDTGCNRKLALKVSFCKSRHEHVRPQLKALHWLPVKERIIFKTATFVCFFEGTLPQQLSPSLSAYTPSQTLGTSSNEKTLLCKMET